MKLNDLVPRKWSSPSRVLCIAGFLTYFYFVIFVFWMPVEWRWVRREVIEGVDESEAIRDVGNATLGVCSFLLIVAVAYVI
jgi:hypothetical protein